MDTAFSWLMAWFVPVAILVAALRQLPRLLRDMREPIQDVAAAPDDAEPMAFVVPNDDGLFTSSLRFRDEARRRTASARPTGRRRRAG